jgi:peptide/nickel transport system ATP-binding protein
MKIVDIKEVSKKYGNNFALKDVSFSVNEGDTFGLVGESGSGKTTLGRILLKLLDATSGKVEYDPGFSRKDYQIVFQNPYTSLDPRMSVGETLNEALKLHGFKKDLKNLLREVELDPSFISRYPHQMSGGERQRVCIARSISIEPKFLVLDEPVSSLDVTVSLGVLKLLKRLKSCLGLTYLFISHDLSVIHYMCDKVAVLKDGVLMETGDIREVFGEPKSEYTKKLLSSSPTLRDQG